jgi:hypothetical protein
MHEKTQGGGKVKETRRRKVTQRHCHAAKREHQDEGTNVIDFTFWVKDLP